MLISPEQQARIERLAMEGLRKRQIAKELGMTRDEVLAVLKSSPLLKGNIQRDRVAGKASLVRVAHRSRLNRQVDRAFKCSLSHHSDGSRIENNQAQHRDATGCIDWYQVRHYLDNKEWAEQLLAGATG